MLKKAKKTSPKIRTEWNLSKFYGYRSPTDPKIKKDVESIKRLYNTFEKKYKNRTDYLKSDTKLLQALKDWEWFSEKNTAYPLRYLSYLSDLDSNNKTVRALLSKYELELTPYGNKVLFFMLRLRGIPISQQKKFLKSKKLKPYKRFLEEVFKYSPHILTEAEEKILNLKSLPAASLWVEGVSSVVADKTVLWEGKQLPLSEAGSKISKLKTAQRRTLHNLILEKLKEAADFSESEVNAIIINKKINNDLRGFKKPHETRLLNDDISEKEFESLRSAVSSDFKTSHRFFQLHKKMLKLSRLTYPDRDVKYGTVKKKVSFKEAHAMLRETLAGVDDKLPFLLDRYVKNGQVDVFPKKGKQGGAYCSWTYGKPVLVFLNHTNDIRSATTFAHEMGHAIHSEYSQKQPFFYQGYSTASAEVASTLFEQFFFDALFEKLSKKEKIVALHNQLKASIATVHRQIAALNFEMELHKKIYKEGRMAKDEMAALMSKHLKSYLGPAVQMKEEDGYTFVNWPHIRMFFYMYSYAYGYLVSRALYEKWKKDPSYIKQIKQFMTAGDSQSPCDIFKSIGVDTTKPSFFKEGLKSIEADIKKLEQLV